LKAIEIESESEQSVLDEYASIVNQYQIMDREELSKAIKDEVISIIEKESDLSDLEAN
jgi:hypothetical protein